MSESVYDVIVLGGGAGGIPAAIRSSQLGGRVALIEHQELGGACMNKGCVPFGQIMTASSILGKAFLGKEMGINFSGVSINFHSLISRQNELISFMKEGIKSKLRKSGVDILRGRGKIIEKGKIEVNGNCFLFKNLIIASGAQWLKPDFFDADLPEVINTDSLLIKNVLPKRVLLFGRSPWLIQIAQFLNLYGSEVILSTPDAALLQNESKVITSRLTKTLRNQEIKILNQIEVKSLEKKDDGLHCTLETKEGQEAFIVDEVICCQRAACLSGIGLENAGLEENSSHLRVNERMETQVPGIYAVGDVTMPENLHYSHSASSGGIIAAENAMGSDRILDTRTTCRVLFTQPQVVCVGLTDKEAEQQGYDVISDYAPLSMNPLGMIISQIEGAIEIVADRRHGEILGVHFIGDNVAEMAGQAILAIKMEATLEEIATTAFPHPTLSESLVEAARECIGQAIYLP